LGRGPAPVLSPVRISGTYVSTEVSDLFQGGMGVNPLFCEVGERVPKLGHFPGSTSQKEFNRRRDQKVVSGTFKHYYDEPEEERKPQIHMVKTVDMPAFSLNEFEKRQFTQERKLFQSKAADPNL